jgi:protein-disulfide isomerase
MFLIAILVCVAPVLAQKPSVSGNPVAQLPEDFVVAVLNGQEITLAELDGHAKKADAAQLFDLNLQLFELRKSILDTMLGERLLGEQARRASQTLEEFEARAIQIVAPTNAEIDDVYHNTPNPPFDLETARPMIARFLEGKKRLHAREAFIRDLIDRAKKDAAGSIVVNLQPPRLDVKVEPADPTQGAGRVELVEFSDFECPFCQRAQPVIKQLLARYAGKIRHVWKDFPLGIHQNAVPAAAAARCAHEQKRFWQYHDLLFSNQDALAPADLKAHARDLGLDEERFDVCFSRLMKQRGQWLARSDDLPVRTTPTILINGRMIVGLAPIEKYERIIEEELAN